jgi:excisionase family DNA binding protein
LEELMNIKDAATYLRLNSMTVYRLAQKRAIPSFKVGGNWRFKKDILDEWLLQKSSLNVEQNDTGSKGFILLVDDDPMVREILKEIVESEGYTVSGVESGEAALEEIKIQHFDLIFLDLKLPGMNGVEILETIKERDKDAVVVLVTGFADEPMALKAMALGPLLLIRKPFREKDIIEVLNIVMKRKNL